MVSSAIDPVTLNVIGTALAAIPREMAANLRRAAFSSVVREARDFSVALLDAEGNVAAQAEAIPIMTAGISHAFRGLEQEIDLDSLTADDAMLMNDPFSGGQHLQDLYLFIPVFYGQRRVGFAAAVAHHVDVGGARAGLNAEATEIYQEGLRLPLARFSVSRDWHGGFVEKIIANNVRVPAIVIGDLNAQFAANATAVSRFTDVLDRYGLDTTLQAMTALQDYAERRLRESIRRIPDGEYYAEEVLDASAWGGDRCHVRATIVVSDTQVHVDFTGTDPQAPANINCPLASTISSAQSALRCLLDEKDIPYNEGCNRPITCEVPYGSILNPAPPAAVRARLTPSSRVFDAIVRALADTLPERVIATGFDTTTSAALSHLDPGTHAYQVVIEVMGGGWGAGNHADGADALDNPISNCANAPIEALEVDYNHFRVHDFQLVPDTGGSGRYRGGLGFQRTYEAVRDGVEFASYSDRHRFTARGLFGGDHGAPGSLTLLRANGETQQLPHVVSVRLNTGDRVRVVTGGGGGYGSVQERTAALITRDHADGLVTDPGT